jgi:hypothetical protein
MLRECNFTLEKDGFRNRIWIQIRGVISSEDATLRHTDKRRKSHNDEEIGK